MVLAGIIKGSQRAVLKQYLVDICQTLLQPDVCHTATVS